MMWQWGDWSWQAWLAMGLMMVTVWVPIVWAVIAITRSTRDDHRRTDAILAERFAHGDIDEAEYRQRRELTRGAR